MKNRRKRVKESQDPQSTYETLAILEIKRINPTGNVPQPSDEAIEQAKQWVDQNEL